MRWWWFCPNMPYIRKSQKSGISHLDFSAIVGLWVLRWQDAFNMALGSPLCHSYDQRYILCQFDSVSRMGIFGVLSTYTHKFGENSTSPFLDQFMSSDAQKTYRGWTDPAESDFDGFRALGGRLWAICDTVANKVSHLKGFHGVEFAKVPRMAQRRPPRALKPSKSDSEGSNDP